ncbi:ThiF family adenylyltransferase [Paenibacillus polysaccharolyticus]|uniref:ThiF family adenylyltransferase n=1 Tax=Paenibacillus polysaccharolyticus TaxID=582692 RepID=UPI00209DE0D5|nr:ThiF family adenylyltransferase [Paenibacillus polysaccharolyticus]MCP1133368.1 ThiF family adenylyltransferase [Paenibacillus polysaccharolyticus]
MQDVQTKVLRLSKGWDYLLSPEGVQIWSLTTQRRFLLHGSAQKFEQLLKLLKSEELKVQTAVIRMSEVSGLSINQVETFVNKLLDLGAIVKADPSLESTGSLYERQQWFFDQWEREGLSGRDFDLCLRSSKVLVVGVGGIGSWIVLNLARIGIQHIVAVDPDHIETSNLPRQILYNTEDVGKLKVEAAARRVQEVDPQIRYEGHAFCVERPEDLSPLLKGVDLVINPFGFVSSRTRSVIAQACLNHKIPVLFGGQCIVGPLFIPGNTLCHQCMLEHDQGIKETLQMVDSVGWLPPRTPFSPVMSISSGLIVFEAARYLSGNEQARSLNGMYVVDPYNFQITFRPGERNPNCLFCGDI